MRAGSCAKTRANQSSSLEDTEEGKANLYSLRTGWGPLDLGEMLFALCSGLK